MAQDPQGVTPLARRIDDELEQAITVAEDAREEAARIARELDRYGHFWPSAISSWRASGRTPSAATRWSKHS